MTTAADIIDQASVMLHGGGSSQDRITPLTSAITDTDETFTVDFAFGQSVGVNPGIVEIDSEQLYVTGVDATSGVCTLAQGFGRGYNNTTPAAHAAGAKVISRPKFSRKSMFVTLNNVVGQVFPQLFAVNTYQTTITFPSNTYTLPNTDGTPMGILDAQWQDPVGNWHPLPRYGMDPYDGTFRLGHGSYLIGRPLRIIYTTQPRQFESESDDLVTQTGLPISTSDVLTLGVVAYLVPTLDISRAQVSSVEVSSRSKVVPANAGVSAGKYVMAEFQNRLANEAQSLRRQYRPRMHGVFR